jgi:hypothetical protein
MLYATDAPPDPKEERFLLVAMLFGLILLPVLLIFALRLCFYLGAMFVRYEIALDRIHLKIERFSLDGEIFTQQLFVESIETITVKRSPRLSTNSAISIALSGSSRRHTVPPFGHLLDPDEKYWLVRELMERVSDRQH